MLLRLEEFRDRFKLGKNNSTVRQYEYDNSTSPECNDIMKQFETSTFNQVKSCASMEQRIWSYNIIFDSEEIWLIK